MKSKYVVVDLETTGNNPKNGDRIIQIAAIVIEEGKIVQQYASYVNPGKQIPLFIQELTGITDADVENAPTFRELAPYIIGVLDEAVFVAHNVLFDLTFLQAELERVGYEGFLGYTVDTVELAKIVNPGMTSFKLEELGKAYGFIHERPHQADSDAYVTALLFMEFYNQLKKLPKTTIKSLYRLSFLLKSELKELLLEILNEYSMISEPWRPDLEIYRGIALAKPKKSNHEGQQQEEESKTQPEEQDYQSHLNNAFSNYPVTLVEDGSRDMSARLKNICGFSNQYRVQVVVATHSKHTAEQLMDSLLTKPMGQSIHNQAQLIHAKEQYLSLPKFEQAMREKQQNYESTIAKMQILVWLTYTDTGCLEELNLSSGGREFCREVSHHANIHPRLLKPWTERDFYNRQVVAAKQSNVIITTHDSLISDIVTKDFLSSSSYIVFEEANYFPSSVQNCLTKELSYVEMRNLLNKIGTLDNRHLLRSIISLVKEKNANYNQEEQIAILLDKIACTIESFFQTLFTYGIKNNKAMDEARARCELVFLGLENKQIEKQLRMEANKLNDSLEELFNEFRRILAELNQVPIEKLKRSQFNMIDELMKVTEEIDTIRFNIIRLFIKPESNDQILLSWNIKGHKNSVQIYSQPLSVSNWINDHVLLPTTHTLFISEALTVGGSFDYFMQKLGVSKTKVKTMVFPALKNHYLTVMSLSNKDSLDSVMDIWEDQQSHLILLFHSQESLKKIYNDMKGLAPFRTIQLQAQGITSGSAIKMLRNHLAFPKSILLMTFSGWNQIRYAYDGNSTLIMVEAPVRMKGAHSDEDDVLSELVMNLKSELNAFPDYKNKGIWVLLENELLLRKKELFKRGLNDVKLIYKNK